MNPRTIWHLIGFGYFIAIPNLNFLTLFCFTNMNHTVHFRNHCLPLGFTSFKQLFYPRQTLGNILSGYTTGMESSHGKLCSRFTYRLSSNYTNSLSYIHHLTCGQVTAITFRTYPVPGATAM